MTPQLTLADVVVPAPDVHAVTLDDEMVLFVPTDATLQHLDGPASLVWSCLTPPATLGEIAGDIAAALAVDQPRVAADVLALATTLVASGALTPLDVADLPSDA
jgi:hypothetical protein